jgi:hypothetical protein
MRFQPGTIPHDLAAAPVARPVKPLSYRIAEANPFRNWLIVLCVGAAFGCASSLIDATWVFGILAQRVRGIPSRYVLRNMYPFLTLGTVALTWVSVWLLTSEEPSLHRARRWRAGALRLLVTGSFLISSAYVLRLLEGLGAQAWTGWFWWLLQSIDILVILLLWPHLLSLAGRLELHGLRWRTLITFIGLLFGTVLAAVPQQVIMRELAMGPDVFRHIQNFRLAVQVLFSTLAALVLLRFAVAFVVEARHESRELGDKE